MMCISCVYVNMQLKKSGGLGLDYVILLSQGGGGGLGLEYRGGGVKTAKK